MGDGKESRARTLEMVTVYIGENGWAPTYREIMEGTGIASKSTVMEHLLQLEREGKLRLGKQERSTGARTIALP